VTVTQAWGSRPTGKTRSAPAQSPSRRPARTCDSESCDLGLDRAPGAPSARPSRGTGSPACFPVPAPAPAPGRQRGPGGRPPRRAHWHFRLRHRGHWELTRGPPPAVLALRGMRTPSPRTRSDAAAAPSRPLWHSPGTLGGRARPRTCHSGRAMPRKDADVHLSRSLGLSCGIRRCTVLYRDAETAAFGLPPFGEPARGNDS